MVWHTSCGDRVLDKIEAEFYLKILQDSFQVTLEAIAALREILEWELS
ncbi:hypothetical protein [Lyngbya sp. CCY1209]|nr:hypothetical protein [Lyngbya sp. CCY1209]MEB3882252.1 hypothetical protein [Lyngbya sp. CCY1209]